MAEQAILDVLRPQRLLQKRIVDKVKHAQAEVIARPPIGIDSLEFVIAER
jgi:hypothetical protein